MALDHSIYTEAEDLESLKDTTKSLLKFLK